MSGLLQAIMQSHLEMYVFVFIALSIIFKKPTTVAKVLTTIFIFNAIVLRLISNN